MHQVLIFAAILLSVLAGAGCDSNPTPHPQAPDTGAPYGTSPTETGSDHLGEEGRDQDANDPAVGEDVSNPDSEVAETCGDAETELGPSVPSGENNGGDDGCDGELGGDGDVPTTLPPEPAGPLKKKVP